LVEWDGLADGKAIAIASRPLQEPREAGRYGRQASRGRALADAEPNLSLLGNLAAPNLLANVLIARRSESVGTT